MVCTIFEEVKAKHGLKIAEYNHKISTIGLDNDRRAAHPIGFQIPEEDDDYEEDEDELL